MPPWVVLYLLGVAGIGVMGVWHHVREKRQIGFILLDAMNKLLVLLTGTAYWHPGLGQSLAPVAFSSFILGVAWLPVEFKTEIASGKLRNPELTPMGNAIVIACGILFGLALFAPLYVWGFLYAVWGQYTPNFNG